MKIGTKVTNDKGWHGVIVERPSYWDWKVSGNIKVVYVHWKEREDMMKREQSRGDNKISDPVVSAWPHELTIIS